jgi:uncharacterized membrane protein HdeD (DUF308 family)
MNLHHLDGLAQIIKMYELKIRPVKSDMILGIVGLIFTGILFVYSPLTQFRPEPFDSNEFHKYLTSLGSLVFLILFGVLFFGVGVIQIIADLNLRWRNTISLLHKVQLELLRKQNSANSRSHKKSQQR